MDNPQKIDKVLERIEPGRREAVRKILLGTTIYVAPVVVSFSMTSLGGVANAQAQNQMMPVPTMSTWSMAGLVAVMGAAGAFLLRRFRGR